MQVLSLNEKLGRHSVTLQNILLATDGSGAAHRALGAAADLARRSGAALHLVTAYEFAPASALAYAPYIGPQSAWDAFEMDARKLLDAESERAAAVGATVASLRVAREPAFTAIMDVAATVEADLVVVGSRELEGVKRVLAGSVSEHVVHSVHRPVLIVRGGAEADVWPPEQVIVGFDGTSAARGAARLAAGVVDLYEDASITLLEAEPLVSIAAAQYSSPDSDYEIDSEHIEDFARSLNPIAGRVVETSVVVGDPACMLIAAASELACPALIVVGSRDLGPVRRLLLGSVSTKLLHSGHASLLVVPEHAS